MTRTEYTKVGTVETTLSLAVRLWDAYTGEQPQQCPRVRLVDRPEQFIRNLSGYHVVTDLPTDLSSVTIAVEGSDRYLPERHVLDAADLASLPQVIDIDLLPAPAYRFPADATVLRGTVGIAEEGQIVDPLPNVELTIVSKNDDASQTDSGFTAIGRSDASGEYVLVIRGLTADDVVPEYDDADSPDCSPVVHVDGDPPVIRAAIPETDRETNTSVPIAEGSVTGVDIGF